MCQFIRLVPSKLFNQKLSTVPRIWHSYSSIINLNTSIRAAKIKHWRERTRDLSIGLLEGNESHHSHQVRLAILQQEVPAAVAQQEPKGTAAAALPLELAVVVVLVMAAAAPSACSLHFSSPWSASGSVGEAPARGATIGAGVVRIGPGWKSKGGRYTGEWRERGSGCGWEELARRKFSRRRTRSAEET